jgi:hypothetical protein
MKKATTAKSDVFDHGQKLVRDLQTPPENDAIYGRIRPGDLDVQELAKNIKRNGILEPLVVSVDGYVLSGNRRLTAARMIDLEVVPVRYENVRRGEAGFVRLIVSYNTQRVKTLDQQARELSATTDPVTAHRRLVESRRRESAVDAVALDLGAWRGRSEIKGNRPLADACIRVVNGLQPDWPLSDRQIHYLLLNDPPRLHELKHRRYANDKKSYRTLTNVLTRLRLSGEISFRAIADETRPITTWNVYAHPQAYLRKELSDFLTDYWRDLQQSQSNHIELIVEKLTVQSAVKNIAGDLCIPLTVGRGFSSIPPRFEMVQRFRRSGKEKLVVIMVSDLDPAGMTIAESFGRSLRDDFGVERDRLVVIKAALTPEQVERFNLPFAMEAKAGASTAREYIQRYGRHVWELEALPPETLKQIVRDALLQVMDIDKLNHEQRKEVEEAGQLQGYRAAVLKTFDHGQESEAERG